MYTAVPVKISITGSFIEKQLTSEVVLSENWGVHKTWIVQVSSRHPITSTAMTLTGLVVVVVVVVVIAVTVVRFFSPLVVIRLVRR
jgi:hypothetical protein